MSSKKSSKNKKFNADAKDHVGNQDDQGYDDLQSLPSDDDSKSKSNKKSHQEKKSKKSKKGKGPFALLNENQNNQINDLDSKSLPPSEDDLQSRSKEPQKKSKKNKKGPKPSFTGVNLEDLEDQDDIDELVSSPRLDEEIRAISKETQKKSKKTKKAPKPSFALLNVEDQNDQEDNDEEEKEKSPSPSDDESTSLSNKPSISRAEPQKESKKGKKAKKKRNDSDEDIDKVLAELEMEYSGRTKLIKEEQTLEPAANESEEATVKKKKKAKKAGKTEDTIDQADVAVEEDDEVIIRTAAQKRKEKKEREKQKKLAQKKAEFTKKGPEDSKESVLDKQAEKDCESKKAISDGEGEADTEGKKKKKKNAKEEPKEPEKKAKGPGKKMIAAMQEALKKAKEEEERLKREEEERIRLEEEREKARLEKLQKEQEKKEKKKLREKQRKEKLKAEGKLLTNKQKQAQARAQAMLEALKAQGLEMPEVGEKKPRPGTKVKPNKLKHQTSTESKDDNKKSEEEQTEVKSEVKTEQVEVKIVDKEVKEEAKIPEETEDLKDAWDATSSEGSEDEVEEDKSEEPTKIAINAAKTKLEHKETVKETTLEGDDEESESESESESKDEDSDEGESEEESDEEDKRPDAERKKEKVRLRIQARRIEAEKKRTIDDLRAAVVCVLGHVDTGKTKILDKLRRTNVQDGEAGGITQQIGATNVPVEAIQEATKHVKGFSDKVFKIPGLLIIDTPGHESFSNLRNRGSSLCDIAVLVVDIMHGLEPQTIESINLLKAKKCPFIVALNKIDRLYDWETMNRKDVQDIIKSQSQITQREFEKRKKDVIVQFAEQSLNAALFYENPDPRSYVSLVPTSAITGEGMGNLLALLTDACQGPLAKRLMFSEELQATVLEVKALPGLGTTIDCILVNGILREGDTMIVAGTEGPIVTQIRSLLMPQPLKELRVKNAYVEYREIKAAQGVKIAAKDLEKAIAGLNLVVAQKPDEVEVLKEEIAKELTKELGKIKLAERGVFVQASTLGALEALLDFLKSSKIPYAGIRIGPVVKKDVIKASVMLEHDIQYATILAFDVKIERDAQELADSLGVKIFHADIIYHLFDRFTEYKEQLRQRKRDEHKHIAVFPCKLKVLPQYVFKSRDPIVMGVMVEAGIVKEGTPICVPSKDFVDLGIVTSIEFNHKSVESARKGQEVCVKIEPIPGEAPKMFGRHFDEKDMLVSKISRQSIDACKDYFRDDLVKTDWQLMVELKKLFQIL